MKWMTTKFTEFSNQFASMVTDNNGTIYHTDGGAGLWTLGPKCDYSVNKLLTRDFLYSMKGIVWNGDDMLYICDHKSGLLYYNMKTNELKRWNLNLKKRNKDGSLKQARFFFPWRICKDCNGDLYVMEKCNLTRVNMSDTSVETLTNNCCGEEGIAVNNNKEIFVTSLSNHTISKFSESEGWTFVAGKFLKPGHIDGPFDKARFTAPRELSFTKRGNLLVLDKHGLRMLDFSKQQVSTIYDGELVTFTVSPEGFVFVVTSHEELVRMIEHWDIQRCLWIGCLKEDPKECYFAWLPKEIVREICAFVFGR